MAKKLLTAKEIRDEINRRMAESEALDGDCEECKALMPGRRPPESGSNWTIEHIRNCVGPCANVMQGVIEQARREFDCSDW